MPAGSPAGRNGVGTIRGLLAEAVSDGDTPSAVCAVSLHGGRLPVVAVGNAVLPVPPDLSVLPIQPDSDGVGASAGVPATPGTLYDLASVTKLFTTVTALGLVDGGVLALDEPVGTWLPAYRSGAKAAVTLRQLLTHTAGLPAEWNGWRAPLAAGRAMDRPALVADLLDTPLVAEPGVRFEYSCAGFNTVMALAEAATARPWAELVRTGVLEPLGLGGPTGDSGITGRPDPALCAATEYMPDLGRGLVRGVVHDEAAWQLGGLAGNAGLFATAPALLDFAEALRTGLAGVLSPAMAAQMWENQLPRVLGPGWRDAAPSWTQGLGLRIGQTEWMGPAGSNARGHSGFTGTSLLVDREAGVSVVLLANSVHPRRDGPGVARLRLRVAQAVRELAGER